MKYALLVASAFAHIHLMNLAARGLNKTTIGNEDEEGESTGPCGANNGVPLTVPTVRTSEPLKFTAVLQQADDAAQVWVYGAVGDNPKLGTTAANFTTLLYSYNSTKGENLNISLDFTQLSGVSAAGTTPVTLQFVQLSNEKPPATRFICADLTVGGNGPFDVVTDLTNATPKPTVSNSAKSIEKWLFTAILGFII
ncbi:hypothetical protein HK103_003098 [Boothiomyces macroporosus]|uniref:Copper acquisition factor BIM1-like domain-containing protein n=1 Tax=Boothiomyces macroporosus TaxID=261099 RepID=A0AAD5Y967_9FUNG|nr:hypothetical protein HK103_003098 [Boothiomyces macroporosus]